MKFGHDYLQILEREGFPPEWVHSAISYRQLKKCIKKVRNELLALGLGPDVLNQLRQPDAEAGKGAPEQNVSIAGFRYSFRSMLIELKAARLLVSDCFLLQKFPTPPRSCPN